MLPPALIRPGRVDLKIHVGLASQVQLEKMFMRFFPGEESGAVEFAKALAGAPLSMAEVQGFFLFFKNDTEGCLKNAKEFGLGSKLAKAQKALSAKA